MCANSHSTKLHLYPPNSPLHCIHNTVTLNCIVTLLSCLIVSTLCYSKLSINPQIMLMIIRYYKGLIQSNGSIL